MNTAINKIKIFNCMTTLQHTHSWQGHIIFFIWFPIKTILSGYAFLCPENLLKPSFFKKTRLFLSSGSCQSADTLDKLPVHAYHWTLGRSQRTWREPTCKFHTERSHSWITTPDLVITTASLSHPICLNIQYNNFSSIS